MGAKKILRRKHYNGKKSLLHNSLQWPVLGRAPAAEIQSRCLHRPIEDLALWSPAADKDSWSYLLSKNQIEN